MDFIESLYRKRPHNPKVLIQYINSLFDKQHILESKFYHDQLEKVNPSDLETNRIGYLLSLSLMNPQVANYEQKLKEANATHEQIYALQLHYYYTFSNTTKMRECALGLLDREPTSTYTHEILFKTIIELEDFELAAKFSKYHLPMLKHSDQITTQLKRIMLKKLIKTISAKYTK